MENNIYFRLLFVHVLITSSIMGQMVGVKNTSSLMGVESPSGPKVGTGELNKETKTDSCSSGKEIKDYLKSDLTNLGRKVESENDYEGQTAVPKTVTVEVLIAVDTALYEKVTGYYHNGRWDRGLHNFGHPEEELKLYLRKFMSAVNNKFKDQFKKPKVKFHISGFIIGEPTKQFIVKPDGLSVYLTRDKMLEFFGNKTLKEKHPFDVALFLTGETKFEPGHDGPSVYGFAEIGRACDYRVTSIGKNFNVANVIAQDLGQFSGVKTAAHEFGHMLGAHHDGLMTSAKCCPDDGHIMSGQIYTNENKGTKIYEKRRAYIWSKCSVKVILKFLRTATCLFNTPATDPYPLMEWGELAEHVPTLNQQCSIYKVDDNVANACGDDPCQYLECYSAVVFDGVPMVDCLLQPKQHAADGSKCGEGKFCHKGECASKSHWMTGHCFDSHQNPQNAGKIPLGNVPDKWDCLKYCRMFGLTGCYWKKVDGECVAHTKDVKFGSGIPGQFWYRFQPFDCNRVKWGFRLPNRDFKVHNLGKIEVKTANDCALGCKSFPPIKDESCYFWSFEGSGPADITGVGVCYLYYRKTKEMEEIPNDKDMAKWAWGSVGSCLRDVCEKPMEHYTIAAKYTREEFIAENQKECEDKCTKPDCGRFEFTAEKKCILVFTSAKGLIDWIYPSNVDCGRQCRLNKECLQWHSSKYKNGYDCRLYKEINKISAKQMARPDLIVGTKYSC